MARTPLVHFLKRAVRRAGAERSAADGIVPPRRDGIEISRREREPQRNCFFAGEHTASQNGFLNSAVETGQRAARQVAASLVWSAVTREFALRSRTGRVVVPGPPRE